MSRTRILGPLNLVSVARRSEGLTTQNFGVRTQKIFA